MTKPLSYRQALALTRHDNEPALTQEAIIIVPIKNLPEPETVIRDIITQTIDTIINKSKRIEKETLKPSSRRSWSSKRTEDIIGKITRRLFSKTIGEERLFLEILRLVREFARVRGEPYSKMGRREKRLSYDPVIVVAILIYKTALNIGYLRLEAKIRELGIDARIQGRRRSWKRKDSVLKPPKKNHG